MADFNIDDKHLRFKDWAMSAGVIMNGIAPAKFPGRGMGMVATKAIDVSDVRRGTGNTELELELELMCVERGAYLDDPVFDDVDDGHYSTSIY